MQRMCLDPASGSQTSQDQLGKLFANQWLMYAHQMELLRKRQLEAAEFKVSLSSQSEKFFVSLCSVLFDGVGLVLTHPTFERYFH